MDLMLGSEPGPLSMGTAAFPRPAAIAGAAGDIRYEHIVYSSELGYRPLFLDLRVPGSATSKSPAPIVVWVHGGGWVYGSRRRQAPNIHHNKVIEAIVAAGFAVAIIDYRFVKEVYFPGQLLDVKAAIRWLRGHAAEYSLDPTRVAVWGESAGGHLSLMTGMADVDEKRTGEFHSESESVQAIVDWYGPTDLTTMLPDGPRAPSEEVVLYTEDPIEAMLSRSTWSAEEMSPLNHVRADIPPIFIAHGTEDQQAPVDQSRRLYQALRDAGATVEYLETPGDHVFVGYDGVAEIVRQSLQFLRTHLATTSEPSLDPDIVRIEAAMKETGDFPIFVDTATGTATDSVEARRRGVRMRNEFYPRKFFPVESVVNSTIPGPAGDINIRIQTPIGGSDATLVYFHGGGWIIGDLDSHEGNASRMAATANAVVIQVQYRLAPENPFPAGFDDVIASIEWVVKNIEQFGGDLTRLAVGGDSAGGNLAAAAALYCRDNSIYLAAQFLIYPAVDLTNTKDLVTAQYLGRDAAEVAGTQQVSPTMAERLDGVAPTVIGVGMFDFLYEECVDFANKLAAAGVPVVLREFPTLNHGFFSYANVSPASDQAADLLCRDLHQLLHP
jgi:acetyl esterase